MTEPIGRGRYLNSAVFPNQLVQGGASTWNGVSCSQFTIPGTFGAAKFMSRIVLQTTLSASDMVGGNGGAYWNPSAQPAIQAPFYLFLGAVAVSNLVDLSLIGAVNVGEQLNPLKIPPNTDIIGVWNGVLAASASKCEATVCFVDQLGM